MSKSHHHQISLDAVARASALRSSSQRAFGAEALLRVLDVAFPDYPARRTLLSAVFQSATAPLRAKPACQLGVKEVAKWLAAAYGQAVRLDPSPVIRFAAYEAVQMSADFLKFEINIAPAEGALLTRALASGNSHSARDMQQILEGSLVPARARAFEQMGRQVAVGAFPELANAYALMDTLHGTLGGSSRTSRIMEAAKQRLVAALRAGYLPRATALWPSDA